MNALINSITPCVACAHGTPPVLLDNGIIILWAGILAVLQLDMLEMNRFNRSISNDVLRQET